MHDVDIREQQGEQLAPANRIALVPSRDKVRERLLNGSFGH
jgi:hypothetical protein